jgi:ssDNA-binding protein
MAKKLSVTPKGVAVYPRVAGKPDTKFNDAGVWSIKLRLEGKDADKLKKEIDAGIKASLEEARKKEKNPVKAKKIKPADAPYQEDEDGSTLFNFKMTASGISKKTEKPWTRKPAVFDAKGKPLSEDIRIGAGSVVKVSFEMSPFYTALIGAGVSLRLEGVQVIELVEYTGGTATSYGFEEEEGFSGAGDADADEDADENAAEEDAEESPDASDGGDDPDF